MGRIQNIIKLNNENYQLWSHQIRILLKAKQVWRVINGVKPADPKESEQYEIKNALAASIILTSVETDQAQQVII